MRVISIKPLKEFWGHHPGAEKPLRQWYRIATGASWSSVRDVRQTYPHADAIDVGKHNTLTVFNIGGNKYRLIARIRYDYQLINVRHVLTHTEYDQGKWKD